MGLKKGIVSQLIVRIAFIVLVVCIFIGSTVYWFINNQLLESVRNEVNLRAENASSNIQNIFENAKIYTSQMAINNLLIDYLKSTQTREDVLTNPLYKETLTLLTKIQKSSKTHFLAWVANEKANFYLDSNGIVPDDSYDVKKRPWYAVAMGAEDVVFTTPYVEWGTRRTVISSIKALRNPDRSAYGFVVVDVVLETIPSIINDIKLTENDQNFLITPEGSYVYHNNSELIMTGRITDETDPLRPYASQILSERNGFTEIIFKGQSSYLAYYPASDTGWILVSIIDKQAISKKATQLTITLVSIIIFGLLLVLLTVVYTLQRKLNPVTYLSHLGDDIANGDFNRQIPLDYLEMEDEMGALAKSYKKIIEAFLQENEVLENKIQEKNLELASQYRHIIETEKMAALGNLVAGVAHEINTPLGVGMSAASYLGKINAENKRKLIDGQMTKNDLQQFMVEMDESLEMLTNNLNRAAELIKSFKQVAVDQSNDGKTLFNLKENIDVVILSLKHEYKHQRHTIINNCPNYLMIDSYPGVYSQIFSNFIMNSIQHGFKGIEEGVMCFECNINNQTLELTYTDNGLGISRENQSRIFEPFFTTNRNKGNNGLGMHIVFNLITQKLKGTIDCSSEEGHGVEFRLNVPLILPSKEDDATI